jgi:hypothetical protein
MAFRVRDEQTSQPQRGDQSVPKFLFLKIVRLIRPYPVAWEEYRMDCVVQIACDRAGEGHIKIAQCLKLGSVVHVKARNL